MTDDPVDVTRADCARTQAVPLFPGKQPARRTMVISPRLHTRSQERCSIHQGVRVHQNNELVRKQYGVKYQDAPRASCRKRDSVATTWRKMKARP